jgi:prefoldin subunit 5
MNLAGKVLADVSRPDTSVVTIDIGLDLHIEMEIEQALAFCTRRAEVLRK